MPSWTTVSKPTQGEATKKPLIDSIVDDLDYLRSRAESHQQIGLTNGSFEFDSTGTGTPDGWTLTTYSNGTSANSISTNGNDSISISGRKNFTFISTGSGGGTLTSNFIEVQVGSPVMFSFWLRSSTAAVHNKFEIIWYDSQQSVISTSTPYDANGGNPTSWTRKQVVGVPPATARYCRIKVTGCADDNVTSGTASFDGIHLLPEQTFVHKFEATATGTHYWTSPAKESVIKVTCVGGGGLAYTAGGGGGGTAISYLTAPASTTYTVKVGEGGYFDPPGTPDLTHATSSWFGDWTTRGLGGQTGQTGGSGTPDGGGTGYPAVGGDGYAANFQRIKGESGGATAGGNSTEGFGGSGSNVSSGYGGGGGMFGGFGNNWNGTDGIVRVEY